MSYPGCTVAALAAAQDAAAWVWLVTCQHTEKKNSHGSSHSRSLLGVLFLQNGLLLPREFLATSLPSWQAFRWLGWAQTPLARGSEDRDVGMAAPAGKQSVQSVEGQVRGRIDPWPQMHLFTVGDGFFRCCLLSFCCWGSELLPGHWGWAGHCSEGRNCVLAGGVLFCRGQAAEWLNCSQGTLLGCWCFWGNRTLGFWGHWFSLIFIEK